MQEQHTAPTKVCKECGIEKPLSEFHIAKLGKQGRKAQCIECYTPKSRENGRRYIKRKQLESIGLCQKCFKATPLPAMEQKSFPLCRACFFKVFSKRALGTVAHWEVLEAQFERQDSRCPYTGVTLILGLNASLDHIKPRFHFPELANNPSNTEWVLDEVNEMKRDRTPEEFLEMLSRIVAYTNSGRDAAFSEGANVAPVDLRSPLLQ